jgi:hypothetical protein
MLPLICSTFPGQQQIFIGLVLVTNLFQNFNMNKSGSSFHPESVKHAGVLGPPEVTFLEEA